MNPPNPKAYGDHSADERLASLDKLQNLLLHPDWRELYLRLADDAADMQEQMDSAVDWEQFVAARAVRMYVRDRLLNLRDLVAAEKDELERDKAALTEPLLPPDYERE